MSTNERRFSIIMAVCDQAYELKENLTAFLSQQYEPGYEVIVVDESSTDETPDVLKLLKNDYPKLYTTFLPKSEGYALSKGVNTHQYEDRHLPLRLKKGKNAQIRIRHLMRHEVLSGITEIGIRIDKH